MTEIRDRTATLVDADRAATVAEIDAAILRARDEAQRPAPSPAVAALIRAAVVRIGKLALEEATP